MKKKMSNCVLVENCKILFARREKNLYKIRAQKIQKYNSKQMTPCLVIIEPKRNQNRFCVGVSYIFVDISLDYSFNVSFKFIKINFVTIFRSPLQFSPLLQVFLFKANNKNFVKK